MKILNLSRTNLAGLTSASKTNVSIFKLNSIEEYNFLHKTKGDSKKHLLNKVSTVDDTLLKQVRDFLLQKHPALLRKALGSVKYKNELKKIINEYLAKMEHSHIQNLSLDDLSSSMVNAIAGLGVIDAILAKNTDDITDIRYNGKDIWIYSNKKLPYKSNYTITPDEALDLAMKIAFATNKEFSNTTVEMDAEISNLRVNAVHPSVSDGASLCFRTITKGVRVTEENFVQTLGNQTMLELLIACAKSKISMAIVGETGTGKTELIKFLTKFIPNYEPINVIEDTPETFMKELYPEKDICNWYTKKSSSGTLEVDISRLLRSGLRNNPSWLIITESRGREMMDIIKAAGTGHGVMTSLHTESTTSSANRMVLMAKEGTDLDEKLISKLIPEAFKIVVHIEYDKLAKVRRIAGLGEYVDFDKETNSVVTNDIFGYTLDGAKFVEVEGRQVLKTERSFKQLTTISDKLAEHFIECGVLTANLVPLLSDNILMKYNIKTPESQLNDSKAIAEETPSNTKSIEEDEFFFVTS